ncbi:MAG TPA: hypothetical protein VF168_10310 [Trueperaceae bacterium]
MQLLTFSTALLLALIHVFSGLLRFLEGVPRNRWLSVAGGVSVAYVFLHLLPELNRGVESPDRFLPAVEQLLYLVGLVGLAFFYGMKKLVRTSRSNETTALSGRPATAFWLHIASFALYNLIVGYLLVHREESGFGSLLWFVVAMALHFIVNDFGLREDHKTDYHTKGRWILATAVVAGWALGESIAFPKGVVTALFAFLAGGIVLNVLSEELPEERHSRFWAFALGAGGYAALLLIA